MRNPLQEQLLKAGLAKKSQVAKAVREQQKQRQGKAPAGEDVDRVDARRLQAERAERDRQLAAERNVQARERELRAQVAQIVDAHQVKAGGEIAYAFEDGGAIRRVYVDVDQRALLARGALVVVRQGDAHALLPRAAAERIRERDPSAIVLDHGGEPAPAADDEDDYYSRFPVPDDLVW
ncbi:DUF2058 domain-containing protein [Marilutibacter spongiae]|uniref:DUF2058 domain-containing protein n=1 Tax=Marilutibacter spongiae TaxID=2025720 RepID=A0A7W3TK13_9GAMM|nr:DUF2058 domain-containing protein [Lysobacter spongiae]MBB1059752.1 DUF2058 domain-containing protein [Lysobacter spongiae]